MLAGVIIADGVDGPPGGDGGVIPEGDAGAAAVEQAAGRDMHIIAQLHLAAEHAEIVNADMTAQADVFRPVDAALAADEHVLAVFLQPQAFQFFRTVKTVHSFLLILQARQSIRLSIMSRSKTGTPQPSWMRRRSAKESSIKMEPAWI